MRGAGERVDVELPPDLPPGSYALSYRVISADGHPAGGSITFAVGTSALDPVSGVQRDHTVAGLLWLARVGMYLGLFVGSGGAFFVAWFARGDDLPSARAAVTAILLVGLAATVLSVGYQGLDALGVSLRSYWTRTVWAAGFDTAFGFTAVVAAAALCAAFASLFVAPRALAIIALAGVGAALAASGHASVAGPPWLTRTAVFVHAVAVAYWVGAFVPLWILLRMRTPSIARIVRAWSASAIVTVALLVLTGGALAIVQVPSVAGLRETSYGWVLLAKLGLVTILLALAALNRFWVTPALGKGTGTGERRLGRSVMAEAVLAAAILALVGLWRFTPPPRAIAQAKPPTATTVYLHGQRAMAEMRFEAVPAGPMRARLFVMTTDHKPLDPKEVTLVLTNRGAGIEPIERKASLAAPGEWAVDSLVVPLKGRWDVKLDLLVSDFEKVALEGTIELRP
jgi:copper transport protein